MHTKIYIFLVVVIVKELNITNKSFYASILNLNTVSCGKNSLKVILCIYKIIIMQMLLVIAYKK